MPRAAVGEELVVGVHEAEEPVRPGIVRCQSCRLAQVMHGLLDGADVIEGDGQEAVGIDQVRVRGHERRQQRLHVAVPTELLARRCRDEPSRGVEPRGRGDL